MRRESIAEMDTVLTQRILNVERQNLMLFDKMNKQKKIRLVRFSSPALTLCCGRAYAFAMKHLTIDDATNHRFIVIVTF